MAAGWEGGPCASTPLPGPRSCWKPLVAPSHTSARSGSSRPETGRSAQGHRACQPRPVWGQSPPTPPCLPLCTMHPRCPPERESAPNPMGVLHRRQATWNPQARVGPAGARRPRPRVPSQCFALSLETTRCLAGGRRRLWQPQVKKRTTPTRGLIPGDDPVRNQCHP